MIASHRGAKLYPHMPLLLLKSGFWCWKILLGKASQGVVTPSFGLGVLLVLVHSLQQGFSCLACCGSWKWLSGDHWCPQLWAFQWICGWWRVVWFHCHSWARHNNSWSWKAKSLSFWSMGSLCYNVSLCPAFKVSKTNSQARKSQEHADKWAGNSSPLATEVSQMGTHSAETQGWCHALIF